MILFGVSLYFIIQSLYACLIGQSLHDLPTCQTHAALRAEPRGPGKGHQPAPQVDLGSRIYPDLAFNLIGSATSELAALV